MTSIDSRIAGESCLPESPSDVLAAISGALFALECDYDVPNSELEIWLSKASETLLTEIGINVGVDEWTLDSHEVLNMALEGIDWPISPPRRFDEFLSFVRALQILDRWHLPLVPSDTHRPMPKRRGHVVAEDRFSVDRAFGSTAEGIMIPASAWGHPIHHRSDWILRDSVLTADPPMPLAAEGRPMVLRELLAATAFLPSRLPVHDPRDIYSPKRYIKLSYSIDAQLDILPISINEDADVIGIAPLLEREDDVAIELSPEKNSYSIRPTYSLDRLRRILKAALDGGVSILFFPESSIDSTNISSFQKEIREQSRLYFKSTQSLPRLRYIFAGFSNCLSPAREKVGENFVSIFDATGREIIKQSKLFPWNLDSLQINRFGLDVDLGIAADVLYENIDIGDELIVCDLAYGGRVINLICADVNENAPGDWLFAHARADWINAPIFDKSTCWTFDSRGILSSWITRRAQRAALLSNTRVVVTNSLALTARLNRCNVRRGDSRIYSRCGIGLLLDSTGETPVAKQVLVPMDQPTPVLATETWGDGWIDLRTA
ncbi:hypothetical protein NKI59_02295 [Mesorhizobium sp. M0598]|uniref:hypothetical protein n=1 Tax=Mesorhizobium sp. M0598 TaxID=2956968 RepID=UPI00333DB259